MYVAQKRLKVGHDETTDTPVYREVGEAVPEAASWPWQALATYVREGHLREVPDTAAEKPAARRPAPKGTKT